MRRLKFRAWDKKRNMMVYGAPEVDPKKCGNLMYCDIETLAIGSDGTLYIIDECGNCEYASGIDEEYEVMQYTGLQDKNGKEVYEGDIVRWSFSSEYDAEDNIVSTVEWADNCSGFYPFVKNSGWRYDIESVEILGNIYENPDLLKE